MCNVDCLTVEDYFAIEKAIRKLEQLTDTDLNEKLIEDLNILDNYLNKI